MQKYPWFKLSILVSVWVLTGLSGCDANDVGKITASELKPGASLSKNILNEVKPIMANGLTEQEQKKYTAGQHFFNHEASKTENQRLGPLFNASTCNACHINNRRGHEPKEGVSSPQSLVIQLGPNNHFADDYDLLYGSQIQTFSINPAQIQPEAEVRLEYKIINTHLSDGSKVALRKPDYRLVNLNYGNMQKSTGISPRYAPNLIGLGLLDAIKDSDLLDLEDVDDNDGDGISGKYNWVTDMEQNKLDIGRFGFKAEHPNLRQQVAAELAANLGLTTSIFNQLDCTGRQFSCQPNPEMSSISVMPSASHEINERELDAIIHYLRFTAVPLARQLNKESNIRGRKLFHQIGCQQCHTPSYTTASDYPIKQLANQKIWPYTDLALHDMGEGLADHTHENYANGYEWRTPPLWGIGLEKDGEARYLHDGRARNITEAILWHGGEAEKSQAKFVKLSRQERLALLDFLQAI